MTSLDSNLDNNVVEIETIEVVLESGVEDVGVTLVANTGPPGPEGAQGPEGIQGPPGEYGTEDETALPEHIASELPHPVYDDGASFFLLYENAKV